MCNLFIIEEVVSTLKMERNAFVTGKHAQQMQGKVLKAMSKDEKEELDSKEEENRDDV